GQNIRVDAEEGKPKELYQIVGVVKDTKYATLNERTQAIMYLAAAQIAGSDPFDQIVFRSRLPAADAVAAVKRTIGEAAPAAINDFQLMETQISESIAGERVMAMLSDFFGMLAVILASIGLYGVISYTVARKKHEIGIRLALGADQRKIA